MVGYDLTCEVAAVEVESGPSQVGICWRQEGILLELVRQFGIYLFDVRFYLGDRLVQLSLQLCVVLKLIRPVIQGVLQPVLVAVYEILDVFI